MSNAIFEVSNTSWTWVVESRAVSSRRCRCPRQNAAPSSTECCWSETCTVAARNCSPPTARRSATRPVRRWRGLGDRTIERICDEELRQANHSSSFSRLPLSTLNNHCRLRNNVIRAWWLCQTTTNQSAIWNIHYDLAKYFTTDARCYRYAEVCFWYTA